MLMFVDFSWVSPGMSASTWWWRPSRPSPDRTSSPRVIRTGPWSTVPSTKGGQETEITSRINTVTISRNVGYNISQCRVKTEDQDEVFDAMKSFPSGHAQIACFTATFLIVRTQLSFSSQTDQLSSGVSPAQTPLLPLPPAEVLAPAGAGHHGRHLLYQQDHGQQTPPGGRLGGSHHRYHRGPGWCCSNGRQRAVWSFQYSSIRAVQWPEEREEREATLQNTAAELQSGIEVRKSLFLNWNCQLRRISFQ